MLWAGKLTRACKQESNVEGVLGVMLENGRVCMFVQQYKHLGSMVSTIPSPALEIRGRIKKATRAFHALARKVFLQHEMDIHLRTCLSKALLVDPPLQFGGMGACMCAGAMGTHFLPQVPAKNGQISPERPFLAKNVSLTRKC